MSLQRRIQRLREEMERVAARPSAPASASASASAFATGDLGERIDTHAGPAFARSRTLAPDYRHGFAPIAPALGVSGDCLAHIALDPSLRACSGAGMLLVDTETTGLAGGAGTLPFLIGLGWFDGDALALQQLILRAPGEETGMLTILADRLRSASCIVTYNGKSFDWPLLRNRFVMGGIAVPALPPHLDLLHCARRLFKRRLLARRLVDIEREVLGFERCDDVDGALIPQIYTDYLITQRPRLLDPVIEHNALDVIALAALLARLREHFAAHPPDARDQLCWAELSIRNGDDARALQLAEKASDASRTDTVCVEALCLRGQLHLRGGDYAAAAACYSEALPIAPESAQPQIHMALAKIWEHKLKDPANALLHARYTVPAEDAVSQARRLARLQARLERSAMTGSSAA